jgi:hypothetical protein
VIADVMVVLGLSCSGEGCDVRVNVAIEVASVQVKVASRCRVSPARQLTL